MYLYTLKIFVSTIFAFNYLDIYIVSWCVVIVSHIDVLVLNTSPRLNK